VFVFMCVCVREREREREREKEGERKDFRIQSRFVSIILFSEKEIKHRKKVLRTFWELNVCQANDPSKQLTK